MIEEQAARLRPAELYPKWGSIELWLAPGESEIDVAYCKPDIVFAQMFRDVDGSNNVRNVEVGFAVNCTRMTRKDLGQDELQMERRSNQKFKRLRRIDNQRIEKWTT